MKRRVEVFVWDDASHQDGPNKMDELDSECRCIHAGLFIQEDKTTLTVAIETYPKGKTMRDIWHIPKGMIQWRKSLYADIPAKWDR